MMIRRTMLLFLAAGMLTCSYGQRYRAVLTTALGKIRIELYDGTPRHRDNFVQLARRHFYDGVLFHRVIPGFMIQGGDPESKHAQPGTMLGNGDVGYTIPAEFRPQYFHQTGALAAARDDNPLKASSGCQFYIVTGRKFTEAGLDSAATRSGHLIPEAHRKVYETKGGAPHLDQNYTVFGQVTGGMALAEKIAGVQRDANDRPLKDEVIKKIRIRKKFLGLYL